MKALIIVNSSSGKGKPDKKLSEIMSKLITIYSDIVICRTYHRPDAYNYTISNLPNCDLVVVIGGDGTLSDVINAIAATKFDPLVAIVPNGTCNDVAHSLKLPAKVKRLANLIIHKQYIAADIMQVNDRFAVYGVALGKFASTSFVTKQSTKKHWGKISYLVNAAKDVFVKFSLPITMNVDAQSVSGNYCLALISNSRFVAGFNIDPLANISDGAARLTLVTSAGRMIDTINISKVFLTKQVRNNRDIARYDFTHLSATFPHPIDLVIDGEKYTADHIDIQVIPRRIKFVCKF